MSSLCDEGDEGDGREGGDYRDASECDQEYVR